MPVETEFVDFIPTLGKTTITGDDPKTVFFLGANNTLLNPTSLPTDIKGFRAYFQLKGEAATARNIKLNFGDEETGISETVMADSETSASAPAYDLQGRRVNNTAKKGVYVVNGKKVIIK